MALFLFSMALGAGLFTPSQPIDWSERGCDTCGSERGHDIGCPIGRK